jgi:hypothetical protein
VPANNRFAATILACAGCSLSLVAIIGAPACAQSPGAPAYEGRSSLGPGGRTAWLERIERARASYEAFAAQARLSLHPKVIEPGATPRPTGIFDDPTLRRGDVVVTPDGLVVFRGSRRFPHISSDFDPVPSADAAASRYRPDLIELQRAHEFGKR